MMDMENGALEHWGKPIIKGFKRAFDKDWCELIADHLDLCGNDGYYSDCEWKLLKLNQYREWVKDGNGDDWFHE